MMTFDKEDKSREKQAIDTYVSLFGGTYKKLDPNDVDYKVFNKEGELVSYVEVVPRIKSIGTSYPLPIDAEKLVKLINKRLDPTIVWSCEDGIVYSKVNKIVGIVRKAPKVKHKDVDIPQMMVYYEKQKEMRYVRYK